MKIITLLAFFIGISGFSQLSIEGYIYDQTTKESLPYATVQLLGTKYYTITNEDGKFRFIINEEIKVDSLEVRFYGFNTIIVPISYFNNHPILYLIPTISNLEEVYLITNKKEKEAIKNNTHNLLYSIIKKYRNKNKIIESKAFLSLTSSARSTPIEHIEGFFNSKQSLSEGLVNLKIKSGRFGQNKSFPFYSLDNSLILKNFQLFNTQYQILPKYIGNMTLGSIKSNYIINTEVCIQCEPNDIVISFIPKKLNGKFFSGSILFDKEMLIVKKINLEIIDPTSSKLSSIVENDIITPKKIALNIIFNPLDFEKVQSYDFTFILKYDSEFSSEIITSHSFLYFFDYTNHFEEPFYTNSIRFKNDYDKIIAQPTSSEFWKLNYQFPKSYVENRSLEFMKEHGYLINYNNSIPLDYIKYIKPAVMSWNKDQRIQWRNIKSDDKYNSVNDNRVMKEGDALVVDKVSTSISDLQSNIQRKKGVQKFNFSYVVNSFKDENMQNHFTSQTLFDTNSSLFNGKQTKKKLIYINLIFDIYEHHRQTLSALIESTNDISYENIQKRYSKKFEEASEAVQKMHLETGNGKDLQNLIHWNNKIKTELQVDNFAIIFQEN